MKKRFVSAFAIIIALLISFNAVGCDKNKSKKNSDSSIKAQEYSSAHYIEGTLHKINVTDSSVPFVKNGSSNYTIYIDVSDSKTQEAILKSSGYINTHLYSSTGVSLSIKNTEPEGFSTSSYAIIYGFQDSLFKTAGLTMPSDDIGSTGYYIKSVGNCVFIEAYGADGYRMAGLAFLRYTLGYDMLSEDCVVYDRTPSTMPSMDIIERPDFDYRQIQNCYTSTEIYGMGMQSHSDIWIPIQGWDMHNTLLYLPMSKYKNDHVKWYNDTFTDVCYTAHGDMEEREAMLNEVASIIEGKLEENPTLENITFSQMDSAGDQSCNCERCKEYKNLYGTPTAATIEFMNELNEKVQQYFINKGVNRTINIIFFAYRYSEEAPVEEVNGNYVPMKVYEKNSDGSFKKDENGNYIKTNEDLKCADNVFPWLAPINGYYIKSYYDEKNAQYAKVVKKWYTLSKNVYLWLYGTDFCYYMYPYNTWSAEVETYRYLKSCGVRYIWNEGQGNYTSTAFSHLKDYIDSKFLFNVNLNYQTVVDDYFKKYYLEACEPMQNMFNLIQAQTANMYEEYSSEISGRIYDEIAAKKYWPRQFIETLNSCIDDAYSAIAKYATSDPDLYAKLVKRIKQESIFPRYVLCTQYDEFYSNIQEMRLSFKNDCNELGFVTYREAGGTLQTLFDSWGV